MSSVRSAVVTVGNQSAAVSIVARWRRQCCDRVSLSQLLAPITNCGRLRAMVDGRPVSLEPSWFAEGAVVVTFLREGNKLTALFFDQLSGQFLQGIAELSQQDRVLLGGRRAISQAFLGELIAQVQTRQELALR